MPEKAAKSKSEQRVALEPRLLRDLAGHAVRHQQRLADSLGLGPTDARCLDFVVGAAADELVTAGYIAQRMGLTTGAITGVLDRLERAGFITREKAPTDRRQVVVRPLASGLRTLTSLTSDTHEAFERVCASRSAHTLQEIQDFVEDVIAMLEAQTEALSPPASTTLGSAPAEPDVMTAPLAKTKDATLELTHGASRFLVRACDEERALFRALLPGTKRAPELAEGVLRVAKASGSFFKRRGHDAWLELSKRVAWDVRMRGGVSNLRAELEALDVRGIEIKGGVSSTSFGLGAPRGTVPFRILGGVSELRVTRPSGIPIRVMLLGGVSGLAIDKLRIGSAGGELRWESPDFGDAQDRYDLEIKGGASDIRIDVA